MQLLESDLVIGIVDGLTLKGYTVLRVGQHRADKAGTDPGVVDLLVGHPRWGNRWVMIECKVPTLPGVKTRKGRTSPEQRALQEAGMSAVVNSIEAAFAVVGERL